MMDCADRFDESIDSHLHRELRDTAWMGGSLTEGRYLLGMLIGKNLFRISHDEYYQKLHNYLREQISQEAADLSATSTSEKWVIPYLRLAYHQSGRYPTIRVDRKHRAELGVTYLFHHLDATVAEIASHLNTTEKQVLRISDITCMMRAIDRARTSGRLRKGEMDAD